MLRTAKEAGSEAPWRAGSEVGAPRGGRFLQKCPQGARSAGAPAAAPMSRLALCCGRRQLLAPFNWTTSSGYLWATGCSCHRTVPFAPGNSHDTVTLLYGCRDVTGQSPCSDIRPQTPGLPRLDSTQTPCDLTSPAASPSRHLRPSGEKSRVPARPGASPQVCEVLETADGDGPPSPSRRPPHHGGLRTSAGAPCFPRHRSHAGSGLR